MQKTLLTSAVLSALLLAGCSSDPEQSRAVPVEVPTQPDGSPITAIGPTAVFDPTTGALPTPNNLAYLGTADGTLNPPVADPTDFGDPRVAMSALDGWSTVAPMVTTFSAAVNPATVVPGQTVRVFKVTLSGHGGAVTGVERELTPGAEFVAMMNPADPTGQTLVIMPTAPLAGSSHYAVVLTNAIEASPAGGLVRVVARADDADGDWELRIEDRGAGVAPELTERIFAAHFTTKPDGHGIGLAVAQQVVRGHHGRIFVDAAAPTEGAAGSATGASFVVLLPVEPPTVEPTAISGEHLNGVNSGENSHHRR